MKTRSTPSTTSKRSVLSINTTPEMRDRLDKLAQQTRRSKSFLANEAIEYYLQAVDVSAGASAQEDVSSVALAKEEAFVARIEQRKKEAQTGELITGEELLSRFENRMEDKFNTQAS